MQFSRKTTESITLYCSISRFLPKFATIITNNNNLKLREHEAQITLFPYVAVPLANGNVGTDLC